MKPDTKKKGAGTGCSKGEEEKMNKGCLEQSNQSDCSNKEEKVKVNGSFTLEVTNTVKVCAAGEVFGRNCQKDQKIPIFSCEGGCIKGEIARLATNLVAKDDRYARAKVIQDSGCSGSKRVASSRAGIASCGLFTCR